jgi:ABC-2 type transport system ATP-binding protein
MMTQPMLELCDVAKRFGQTAVLQGLSFRVNPGEVVGLVGPNGSGKTTTVRLANGVIRPDGGAITVGAYNPVHDGDAIRQMSGILTESAGLYANLSGLQNLRFFASLYGVTDLNRPLELLEQFGLGEVRDRIAGTYSTGMKKRLGLAKALLHRPRVLFLDEPTNGLDPEGIRMVLAYIAELNRQDGTTVIICSHLLQQLERVCHRYLFIERGRLIEEGALAELEAKYRGEVRLQVETDLAWEGERYAGFAARRTGPGTAEFTLPDRSLVSELLRRILQEASVYSATALGEDLESLYFKIQGVKAHE